METPVYITLLAILFALPSDAAHPPEPMPRIPLSAPAEHTSTGPQLYEVNREKTELYALAYRGGTAGAFAHDHVIEATQYTAQVTWDESNPAQCALHFEMPVAGLSPDRDKKREEVNLPKSLSEKAKAEILANILSKKQLWLEGFSNIVFTSTNIPATEGVMEMSGTLTIRGVTKPVTVPTTVIRDGKQLTIQSKFKILQSDYGYAPYSAMLGALKVKDQVDIIANVVLKQGSDS